MPADSSLVSPVSLAALTDSVRGGEQRLQDVVNEACDRIELLDLQVRAVLPEAGRRDRLLAEAEQLADRYPDHGVPRCGSADPGQDGDDRVRDARAGLHGQPA